MSAHKQPAEHRCYRIRGQATKKRTRLAKRSSGDKGWKPGWKFSIWYCPEPESHAAFPDAILVVQHER